MNDIVALDLRIVPPPPRLHWSIVLVLEIVTFGLFGALWLFVQARWVKKMTGNNGEMVWPTINLCAVPSLFLLALVIEILAKMGGHRAEATELVGDILGPSRLFLVVLNLATVFSLRSSMEGFPIYMSLGGGVSLFFGPIYFQYKMKDYILPSPEDVYGPLPDAPAYVPATSPGPSR
jgi:hypothetical protein